MCLHATGKSVDVVMYMLPAANNFHKNFGWALGCVQTRRYLGQNLHGDVCSSFGIGSHASATHTAPTGYYCVGGATRPDPTDGQTGGLCPTGAYCPTGSSGPTWCPPGSVNPAMGSTNATACQPCSPGYYCAGSGHPGGALVHRICRPGFIRFDF